jgi:hypothetical protein
MQAAEPDPNPQDSGLTPAHYSNAR